ncbi:MAG: hypothetical protein SXA11_20435 [Cyanobacteriota bacterium]|nr:hypothetical protein [Cyanobacteriota bacterium]
MPIPEKKTLAHTSFRLCLRLTNQTLRAWKFKSDRIITPELVAAGGQVFKRKLTTYEPEIYKDNWVNKIIDFISKTIDYFRKIDASWVHPQRAMSISIQAQICWYGDSLQLQLSARSSPSLNDSFHFWVFEGLKLGNYRLKFSTESGRKTQVKQGIKSKERKGDRLTTSYVNLRLVEVTKLNDKAIEVDDICFQALVPERVFILQDQKVEIPVKMGIRITNNTQTHLIFRFYNTLIPELITPNWQRVDSSYSSNILKTQLTSDFLLAMPKESVTFFPHAKLIGRKDDLWRLKIARGDGGYWYFNNLKAGKYWLRFAYKNSDAETRVYNENTKKIVSVENLWRGMVLVPFVELCFRKTIFYKN